MVHSHLYLVSVISQGLPGGSRKAYTHRLTKGPSIRASATPGCLAHYTYTPIMPPASPVCIPGTCVLGVLLEKLEDYFPNASYETNFTYSDIAQLRLCRINPLAPGGRVTRPHAPIIPPSRPKRSCRSTTHVLTTRFHRKVRKGPLSPLTEPSGVGL